jgi:hypothetical protein
MKIVCHIFSAFTKQILPNKTFVYEKKSCQHTHLIEGVSNWPLGCLRLFQDYAGSSWPSWIEGEPCRRQPPFCSKRFYQYRLSPLFQTDWLEEEQSRSRTLPLLTTQDLLKKNKGLIVNLKFNNPNGSPADASFVIYLGYTDTWMKFKEKKFISPYRLYWREQPLIICVNMNWRKK